MRPLVRRQPPTHAVYVPVRVPLSTGYGITTDPHGAGDNFKRNPSVTVERTVSLATPGTGSIVYITNVSWDALLVVASLRA